MKPKIHHLLLALLVLPLTFFAKESLPDYYVGKASIDKTLKAGEAVYVLTFTDYGSPMNNKAVTLAYNGVEKKITTNASGSYSLKLKPGKYKFQFYVKEYYEITTDSIPVKSGFKLPVEVNFMSSTHPVMVEKPVVYVYAPEKTNVRIQLEPKEKFSFTYPAYKNGWDFSAGPDGTISMDNKQYPYLFWEALLPVANDVNTKEGYYVNKENMVSFLEDKLAAMGLNEKESTDFITYWCPRMSEHAVCYVHFLFNNQLEKYAPMSIEPKPDNLFRVCMAWSPVNEKAGLPWITKQEIPALKRTGLTVVEWGGTEIQLPNP
jgi:hypothetical protein